jgi:hypothetical protein
MVEGSTTLLSAEIPQQSQKLEELKGRDLTALLLDLQSLVLFSLAKISEEIKNANCRRND